MIAIVDYDVGNIAAVDNMLRKIGAASIITSDPAIVATADRIILPGNGSFDACVNNLKSTGLLPLIESRVIKDKVPFLGICVGAQMLGHSSEEGEERGLGWIDMSVAKFPHSEGLPVPHMGWCSVSKKNDVSSISSALDDDAEFYFVHSYYMKPCFPENVFLTSWYGFEFASGVIKENILGVQFHPEKSHRFGKALLEAFSRWEP